MSTEVPEDIQRQIDELRAAMEVLLDKYSQGVPWSHFVAMTGSVRASMTRLLDRADEIPLSARVAGKPRRRWRR